ncbi:hypothetical protein Dd703_0672 [Musicola paradisiaca Ech703]|uniref:Uncharacterized protein n=1 Tax=Musicola paradisiaca (strain Ech703) TaxID=579405 RepID=C6C9N2_MUSP7|nr:hypothetical protein Dd703_0672 [Musicola paradisiaca Ech703]
MRLSAFCSFYVDVILFLRCLTEEIAARAIGGQRIVVSGAKCTDFLPSPVENAMPIRLLTGAVFL